MASEQPAPQDHVNLFSGVTKVITDLGRNLESVPASNTLPNWQRIARIAKYSDQKSSQNDPAIVSGVKKATKLALVPAVFGLVKLVLKAQTMLDQLNSAKALGELSAKLLEDVATADFFKPFEEFGVTNPFPQSGDNSVKNAVETVFSYASKLPSPEDLDDLGAKLAELIVLKYNTDNVIDPAGTGKIRLLWWALANSEDQLPLPFECKVSGEKLTQAVSSYWLGCSSSLNAKKQKELKIGDTGIILFGNGRAPAFPESVQNECNAIAESLGYKDYDDFKNSCAKDLNVSSDSITDEVALNRLWGVDISDPNKPKLRPLPSPPKPPDTQPVQTGNVNN